MNRRASPSLRARSELRPGLGRVPQLAGAVLHCADAIGRPAPAAHPRHSATAAQPATAATVRPQSRHSSPFHAARRTRAGAPQPATARPRSAPDPRKAPHQPARTTYYSGRSGPGEITPELRQHGDRRDATGAVQQAVHHDLRCDQLSFGREQMIMRRSHLRATTRPATRQKAC